MPKEQATCGPVNQRCWTKRTSIMAAWQTKVKAPAQYKKLGYYSHAANQEAKIPGSAANKGQDFQVAA